MNRPPIDRIWYTSKEGNPCEYAVGLGGCNRIAETEENGEYAMIPYVEVYMEGSLKARFCQHKLDGIFYSQLQKQDGGKE